ncbi:MAG: BamA/TamA family outer membrane protein [Bacteroidetes bacterium]|nr:BamA/TamA family outer membrane protein [Bacteroidota bacterium]
MAFLFANISRAKTNSLHVIDTFKITKTDSTKNKRFKIIGLPLLFYVPETKFGGGGAGLVTFKLKNDSINTRTSSVQFDVAYTQLKQTLVYMPFQLWIRNETYNVYGEIGYYKYNYFFWGIGDKQPSNLKELYDVKFPRLKINALKRIAPHIYTGIKYNYDNFQIIRLDTAGLLSKGDITGSKGGIVSSLGFVVKYDSRDNLFYPTKGYLAEFSFQVDDKIIGSSFSNNRIIFDGSAYFTNEIKHTVALNFYSVIGNGDIPFNQMALLGGAKKMRGFYEGRYRDKNLLMLQTEYRIPLFWRLGAVVFISTGNVSDKVSNFNVNQFKLAYGGGLRVLLDKKQKINIRFDIGWAEPKPNFYLTVTEAF